MAVEPRLAMISIALEVVRRVAVAFARGKPSYCVDVSVLPVRAEEAHVLLVKLPAVRKSKDKISHITQ